MKKPPAFVLLLWRPAVLLFVLPLGLGLWLATLGTTGNAANSPETYQHLGRAAIVFPAMVSVFISLLLRELEHTTFAWTLPGLQSSLRNGKIMAGAILAATVAFLLARVAPASTAVGAGGLALFCFALGGIAFDPVLPKTQTWPVRVLLIGAAYKPLYAEQLVVVNPIVTSAVFVVVSAFLLQREFSRDLARERSVTSVGSMLNITPGNTRRYWAQYAARDIEWVGNLTRSGLLNWIRAGTYETYGGARVGYFGHLLSIIVITVIVAQFSGNLSGIVMLFWLFVGMMGIQLSGALLYPLHRRQRARVFFSSTIAQSTATTLAAFAALLIGNALGVGVTDSDYESGLRNLLTLLALAVAWSPIVHWPKMRGPSFAAAGQAAFALRFVVFQGVFVVATTLSHVALTDPFRSSPQRLWVIIAALALTTHAVYALAVHRHFSRKDLVAPR